MGSMRGLGRTIAKCQMVQKLPIFGQLSRKGEVWESKGLNKVVSFAIFDFQIKKN